MNNSFVDILFTKHSDKKRLPSPLMVENFIEALMSILFPAYNETILLTRELLEEEFEKNENQLKKILSLLEHDLDKEINFLITNFYLELPVIYEQLLKDAAAIESGDPAARGIEEVMRSYPGFYAISIYRVANLLYKFNIPFIPRILTEIAHSKTGIDIHPAARIGESFFIDHGTGIVIGETTIIGNNVKLYQGVTLGALSVKKEMAEIKRHPTIEDGVVIYAGATILGGKTIIGKNTTIGGNVWITTSVDENSMVLHQPELIIHKNLK